MRRRKLKRWLRIVNHWFLVVPIGFFFGILFTILYRIPLLSYYWLRRKGWEERQFEELKGYLYENPEEILYSVTKMHGEFACIGVSIARKPILLFSDLDVMDRVDKLVRNSGTRLLLEEHYHGEG